MSSQSSRWDHYRLAWLTPYRWRWVHWPDSCSQNQTNVLQAGNFPRLRTECLLSYLQAAGGFFVSLVYLQDIESCLITIKWAVWTLFISFQTIPLRISTLEMIPGVPCSQVVYYSLSWGGYISRDLIYTDDKNCTMTGWSVWRLNNEIHQCEACHHPPYFSLTCCHLSAWCLPKPLYPIPQRYFFSGIDISGCRQVEC